MFVTHALHRGDIMSARSTSLAIAAAAAIAGALFAPAPAAAQSAADFHVAHTYTLGGEGGWDYVIYDPGTERLYIGRQDRIMVVDPANGKLLGQVPDIHGAHGIAIDKATGHGFATSGRDSSIVMFDLKTFAVLNRTHAADDADAIIFDPASKRVLSFNGDAESSTVVDPVTGKTVGNIPLAGKPEYGVADGHGHVFANIESTAEVVEIDPVAMRVTRRWSIAPCSSPTGLAMDVRHERLFSGCRSKVMAISDARAGKLITTLPIGAGVDAAGFDPGLDDAFSSNGDGTVTVIHEDTPNTFHVAQTVTTANGARTMSVDAKDHRLYLVTADFGPMPAAAPGTRRRPPMIPGTFKLLVVER
jgi:hypothetical protein